MYASVNIIGSDNGLSPGWRHSIIWTNLGNGGHFVSASMCPKSITHLEIGHRQNHLQTPNLQVNSSSLTHWPLGDFNKVLVNSFQVHFIDWWLGHLSWNSFQVDVFGPHWWEVNIGSGNGLVPSGSKPLPEPMLTQIHIVSLGHNELSNTMGYLDSVPVRTATGHALLGANIPDNVKLTSNPRS